MGGPSRTSVLLAERPIGSMAEYVARGGGRALEIAGERGPDWIIEEVRRAGLRGRGGAGFPTGVNGAPCATTPARPPTSYATPRRENRGRSRIGGSCATTPTRCWKDSRSRRSPSARQAPFIGIKSGATRAVERVRGAIEDMTAAGLLGSVPIEPVEGPDEYLFGEEKALLEVIEGNPPMPRTVLPWMEGPVPHAGQPEPDGRETPRRSRTCRTSCVKEPSGSARSAPRIRPERCCSRWVATCASPACTSCRWASRSPS